jgi:ribosome-associated translation inhibitor RaiA
MRNTVEISLRGIAASDALERYIRAEVDKLAQVCDCIGDCLVVAEALQPGRQRALYAARLVVTLPGTEFMVNREHRDDVYLALGDAFAAAGTRLKEYQRRRDAARRGSDAKQGPRS